MNFEKIGQFIFSILVLGAGAGWLNGSNMTVQITVIMVLLGAFIFWAGSSLEEMLRTKRVKAQYKKEEEEENND